MNLTKEIYLNLCVTSLKKSKMSQYSDPLQTRIRMRMRMQTWKRTAGSTVTTCWRCKTLMLMNTSMIPKVNQSSEHPRNLNLMMTKLTNTMDWWENWKWKTIILVQRWLNSTKTDNQTSTHSRLYKKTRLKQLNTMRCWESLLKRMINPNK